MDKNTEIKFVGQLNFWINKFNEVLLTDYTTIRLFSDILKGVGRNPGEMARKQGDLKSISLLSSGAWQRKKQTRETKTL